MPNPHMFTVILDTYYRPAMLKEAVEALFRQTYSNLEIILVNNGATEETVEYLHQVAAADDRVKLVHFEENQYSPDDPFKMLDTCLNAALEVATGDYIWYQSDDDLIADDYAEKMVALFKGNPECTTAAGVPVGIDAQRKVLESGPRRSNHRPRYMPGHQLALHAVRGGRTMFSAPGTILTIRRDALVKAGGFHRALDLSQLYGIIPFGVTGFDETALFYWRRHEGQLNLQLTARGWIGIDVTLALLKQWDLEHRWQIFGPEVAREVVTRIRKNACKSAARSFVRSLYARRLGASIRIVLRMWYRRYFWIYIPSYAAQRLLLMYPLRRWLKPRVKRVFELWPALASVSPRLRERVDR